jgi:hypothetical protein
LNERDQKTDARVAKISAMLYTPISIGSAAIFFILSAGYPLVARAGGAAWTAILSIIVAMPLVITAVKQRVRAEA